MKKMALRPVCEKFARAVSFKVWVALAEIGSKVLFSL